MSIFLKIWNKINKGMQEKSDLSRWAADTGKKNIPQHQVKIKQREWKEHFCQDLHNVIWNYRLWESSQTVFFISKPQLNSVFKSQK